MGELTAVWSQGARAKLDKQAAASNAALQDRFFQFVCFNLLFVLTLKLESFPDIVDLPDGRDVVVDTWQRLTEERSF